MASFSSPSKMPPAPKVAPWNDPNIRAIAFQIVVMAAFAAVAWWLVSNALENLRRQNIASGFDFLGTEAGFDVGDTLIHYTAANTYARAIWVGILNMLRVALLAMILATVLGTLIGMGRLSKNWLLAKICSFYVELIRNIPLLLQLFVWIKLFQIYLPDWREAASFGNIFLSRKGLQFPVPIHDPAHIWIGGAAVVAIAASVMLRRWARQRQERTGQQFPSGWGSLGLFVGVPLIVFLLAGAPLQWDVPRASRFGFAGGSELLPEFTALLLGLTFYTAAFIAEIVRAGILAINKGQTEAAFAVGLRPGFTTRLVILPQALRVIIPPMTSQYLNIAKNSSLAIAIGYPDVVAMLNVTMNQTGQAIEGVAIIMAIYLTVSLSISAFMNWYNKRIALVER